MRYTKELATFTLRTTDIFAAQEEQCWCDEKSGEAGVHILADGRVLVEFHHDEFGSAIPAEAWDADIIICCHPEWLDEELRAKHPAPAGYFGTVATSITGGFDEPVTLILRGE